MPKIWPILLSLSLSAGAPECPESRIAKDALSLAEAGNFAAAAKLFRVAAEAASGCLDHRVGLAASLERAGRPAEAASELEKAASESKLSGDADREAAGIMRSAAKRLRSGGDERSGGRGAPQGTICLSGRGAWRPDEAVFTFLHVSDPHIGQWMDGGLDGARNLAWVADTAWPVLKPAFIAATGDLTDSTNGFIIPLFGPHVREWRTYSSLISGLPAGALYDMPGNHDHYGDRHFSSYLAWSSARRLQYSWTVEAGGSVYRFIAVNTAANNGRPWPWDDRGLDDEELSWLAAELRKGGRRIFVFGHHPTHRLRYGREKFERLLREHGASYFHGHSHDAAALVRDGGLRVNVGSLGKSDEDNYVLAAVLADDVCVSFRTAGSLR